MLSCSIATSGPQAKSSVPAKHVPTDISDSSESEDENYSSEEGWDSEDDDERGRKGKGTQKPGMYAIILA